MSRILVTGATGLVGSHLVPMLAGKAEVTPVSRADLDLSVPLDPEGFPDRIDAVVYLAQSRRFREFPGGAMDMLRVNVEQAVALAAAAAERGARHFVYASTGSVYRPSTTPLRETDTTLADNFYAASKLAAEELLRPFAGAMNVQILRFFFIYGAGQRRDMLLPRLVDKVAGGSPVALAGKDGMLLQPLHASDAASAIRRALGLSGSHTINVAGPEVLSLRAIGEAIGNALCREPVFEQEERTAAGDLIADTSLMLELLGPAEVAFADGVGSILP